MSPMTMYRAEHSWTSSDHVAVTIGAGPTGARRARVSRARVLRVWVAQRPGACWAYLEGVGWRRVPAVSEDGRRDALDLCRRARTDGLRVTAEVTDDDILDIRV